MKELLQKLINTPAPSGYETQLRLVIQDEVAPFVKDSKVDALGNLIVRMGEKAKNGKTVMIAAHMDEIGVIISHVEKNGLARFSNVGSVFPRYLAGSHVRFLNGTRGLINSDKPDDLSRLQPLDKYFIDTGASNEKTSGVKAGDLGVFEREFMDLGDHVVGKALDDRSGCAVMIEVIRKIKKTPNELVFVFSTQEEVGSRGAQTAAFGIDTDLGIAIDVTPVGNILGKDMRIRMNAGPSIKVQDVGFIADPRVVQWMRSTAEKNKIPCQLEVLDIGSTDARAMQISKAGMLSGALSIPCKYVHSPSELIDMHDYALTIELLTHLLSEPISLD